MKDGQGQGIREGVKKHLLNLPKDATLERSADAVAADVAEIWDSAGWGEGDLRERFRIIWQEEAEEAGVSSAARAELVSALGWHLRSMDSGRFGGYDAHTVVLQTERHFEAEQDVVGEEGDGGDGAWTRQECGEEQDLEEFYSEEEVHPKADEEEKGDKEEDKDQDQGEEPQSDKAVQAEERRRLEELDSRTVFVSASSPAHLNPSTWMHFFPGDLALASVVGNRGLLKLVALNTEKRDWVRRMAENPNSAIAREGWWGGGGGDGGGRAPLRVVPNDTFNQMNLLDGVRNGRELMVLGLPRGDSSARRLRALLPGSRFLRFAGRQGDRAFAVFDREEEAAEAFWAVKPSAGARGRPPPTVIYKRERRGM